MNQLHFALLGLVLAFFSQPLSAQDSISDVFADPALDFAVQTDGKSEVGTAHNKLKS